MASHREVSHGVQWTIERRAVGKDRPASAAPQTESARRATSGGPAQVLRRHSVDSVDRRTVESTAAHVRQFDHVLEAAAPVG